MTIELLTSMQRNIFNEDCLVAWAYRTRRYFQDCKSALDIGCGIGYQTAEICRLHPNMHVYCIDKTGIDKQVSYSQTGYSHNDLAFTQDYLKNYNCSVYDSDDYTWDLPIDVVYSTLSWGWHYPIALYLKQVLQLKPRYIIIDQRQQNETIPGYRCIDQFQINRKELTRVYVTQKFE